jgi:hypothetical protein
MSLSLRCDAGGTVPDGKYKIQVFDYEFFVEIDNTPPDVGVALDKIKQKGRNDWPVALRLYSEINCHVYDTNIKNWALEYGEGDNSQDWYTYTRGSNNLFARDTDGAILRDSNGKPPNISCGEILDPTWLVGKKFRISGEDLAGSKNAIASAVLEEKVVLYMWDGAALELNELLPLEKQNMPGSPSIVPAPLTKPGLHQLNVLETIRARIISINVQYWARQHWNDSPESTNPPPGDKFFNLSLMWPAISRGEA